MEQQNDDLKTTKQFHPKGSAEKVFSEFWDKIKKDKCDRKTLSSLSFDAGHSLRHEEYEKAELSLMKIFTSIMKMNTEYEKKYLSATEENKESALGRWEGVRDAFSMISKCIAP